MFLLFDFIVSVCASDFDFTQRDAMMRRSAVDAYRVGLVELCLNRNMQGFMDNVELQKMHYARTELDPKLYPCPSKHKAQYEKSSLEQSFALVESAIEEGYAPAIAFLLSLKSLPICLDLHRCFVKAGDFQKEAWSAFNKLVDKRGMFIQDVNVYLNLLLRIEKDITKTKQSQLLDFIYRCYCCAHSGRDFDTEEIQRAYMKREIEDHIKCSLFWKGRAGALYKVSNFLVNPMNILATIIFNGITIGCNRESRDTALENMHVRNCSAVDLTGCFARGSNETCIFWTSLVSIVWTCCVGLAGVYLMYEKFKADKNTLLEEQRLAVDLNQASDLLSLYMIFKGTKQNPRYVLDFARYVFWYPVPYYRPGYYRSETKNMISVVLDYLYSGNEEKDMIETLLKSTQV